MERHRAVARERPDIPRLRYFATHPRTRRPLTRLAVWGSLEVPPRDLKRIAWKREWGVVARDPPAPALNTPPPGYHRRVRAFVAVVLALAAVLAGAAVAVSHSTPHSATRANRALTASRGGCSSGSECTRGCTIYVATKTPKSSPTAPCSNQAVTPCTEDVAASPSHPAPPTAPTLRECPHSPTGFPNRVLPPRAKELRPRAERYLRSLKPKHKSR